MSKWVEVAVTINKVFAVEIEDAGSEKDAEQYVRDELMDFQNIEFDNVVSARDEVMAESIKRHSDEKLRL